MLLVKCLADRIGSEVSYDGLARETGLSKHTVSDYIDLLEQCFVIRQCTSFSRNVVNEIKKGISAIWEFETPSWTGSHRLI